MKKILLLSVFLFILGSLVVAVNFQPLATGKQANSVKSISASNSQTSSVSPNIIPIITLNSKEEKDGIPLHEPCAATRLTPTLLITAAHCFAGVMDSGSRINASLFKAQDGTEGLIFYKPNATNLTRPNAQVFLYKPIYTNPGNIPIPFDFAVVVLEPRLQFNSALTQNILKQLPANLPKNVLADAKSTMQEQITQQFSTQSLAYTKFINKSLSQVALLTMTPGAVVSELKGRQLKAYFWNGYPYNKQRDRVEVLSERINEPEGTASAMGDSHLMLFTGEEFHQGTSGSPIFDPQRKLVVSVASGCVSSGHNAGGLIDETLYQWVKSYDSNVKCLVRHDGVVANEVETPNL